MIILIDGYNLLKQRFAGTYVDERLVAQFIHQLSAYRKKRGHSIVVVFDGGTMPWPEQKRKHDIMIVYAGHKRTADDYIKNYISEHHNSDLLLVSSDRELNNWASRYDVVSMNSLDFFGIMKETLGQLAHNKKNVSELVKTTENSQEYLDEIMRESSMTVKVKEDGAQGALRSSRSQKLAKHEKLLRKKIEKL